MKSLATKCGYFFFSKECVNAITKEVLVCKDSEDNKYLVATSLSLLVVSAELLIITLDSHSSNTSLVKTFCQDLYVMK